MTTAETDKKNIRRGMTGREKSRAAAANTTALAYMGDAVYEVAVRRFLMESGQYNADRLHRQAIRFVCARSQARILKTLFPELSGEEQALARRARNHKTISRPKNADPVEYKLATAFEALVGYLYLSGQQERLQWLLDCALAVISGEERPAGCDGTAAQAGQPGQAGGQSGHDEQTDRQIGQTGSSAADRQTAGARDDRQDDR